MKSLLSEMKQCKTVEDCFEVATVDAYGEEEQAVGWLTCIQVMFDKFEHVSVLGQEMDLEGFDLANERAVVATCRQGKKKTKIALDPWIFQNYPPRNRFGSKHGKSGIMPKHRGTARKAKFEDLYSAIAEYISGCGWIEIGRAALALID